MVAASLARSTQRDRRQGLCGSGCHSTASMNAPSVPLALEARAGPVPDHRADLRRSRRGRGTEAALSMEKAVSRIQHDYGSSQRSNLPKASRPVASIITIATSWLVRGRQRLVLSNAMMRGQSKRRDLLQPSRFIIFTITIATSWLVRGRQRHVLSNAMMRGEA